MADYFEQLKSIESGPLVISKKAAEIHPEITRQSKPLMNKLSYEIHDL